jgi:O-antigen ligase
MSFLRISAVVLLHAFAVVSPFSLGAASVVGVTLLFGGMATWAVHAPARRAVPPVILAALGAWLAWTALATATAAPHPVRWMTWLNESWIKLFMVAVAALVVVTRTRADRLLHTYLWAGTVVAVFGIWQHFTGTIPIDDDIPPPRGRFWEIEAFYNHHLTYGGHVVALWILALTRAVLGERASLDRRALVTSAVTVALLGLALLWSYARSAHLGAVAGLVFLAFFLPRRRRALVGVALAIGVIAVLATPALRAHFGKALDPQNEQTRLNLWSSSVHAIADRPWTGFGVGNFGSVLELHEVEGDYNTRAHSHNDYLMHAVNAGLPALGFALLMLGGTVFVLVRARHGDAVTQWIVLGAAAANVAIASGGMVQVFQSDDEVEMTLYLLLGVAFGHLAQRRSESSS